MADQHHVEKKSGSNQPRAGRISQVTLSFIIEFSPNMAIFCRYAERKSIIDYVLLDPAEKLRTGVKFVPPRFKSSIIRAPVPWRQTLLVAKQYCRHNLFITNPIIQRIRVTWERRYRKQRFVDTQNLRGRSDNPLSPEEMQEKVFEQCRSAKDMLLNVRSYFI